MTQGSPANPALPVVLNDAFPHSHADSRKTLARAAGVRTFDPGEVIVRQGDESSMALILGGHVAFRRTTVHGRQLILRVATRGALAVILPLSTRPAGGDAVALTPSLAARWRGEEVRSLAAADPGLAIDLIDHTLATFEEVVACFDGLLYHDAQGRVARVLHLHADLFFSDQPVLTRAHLPILVGTSREMTGRVLRALEARRLVSRVGRDRLRLLDAAGLAEAAEPQR
ncbi:MAG: Cyclic nucleotide-binding domain [Chloroflexota bacterium]|nr:Cyclic nucleotide-binding domain [Chloroflexota bacterium]